ncbi:MAG: hypothetical protein HQK53_09930 [Oligoflexia bacterium]|nr:hypothetical protein [Oligoflexia bacterium]
MNNQKNIFEITEGHIDDIEEIINFLKITWVATYVSATNGVTKEDIENRFRMIDREEIKKSLSNENAKNFYSITQPQEDSSWNVLPSGKILPLTFFRKKKADTT